MCKTENSRLFFGNQVQQNLLPAKIPAKIPTKIEFIILDFHFNPSQSSFGLNSISKKQSN